MYNLHIFLSRSRHNDQRSLLSRDRDRTCAYLAGRLIGFAERNPPIIMTVIAFIASDARPYPSRVQ